jgi:hypothetical protein
MFFKIVNDSQISWSRLWIFTNSLDMTKVRVKMLAFCISTRAFRAIYVAMYDVIVKLSTDLEPKAC